MLNIHAKIPNMTADFARALDEQLAYTAIGDSLRQIGRRLAKTSRDGINASTGGYKSYYVRGRLTSSSRPGEYPRSQTGQLRHSIGEEVHGLRMEFGSKASYSIYLQNDNPNISATWTKVAPRPFLTLAHNSLSRYMPSDMLTSIRRRLGI